MEVNINGIDERALSYSLYLDECEWYNEEPLGYSEWLEQEAEAYEQAQIDHLFMTDAEKYGEED